MFRVLALVILSALRLSAATYYVRTNGNDSADGSSGTPWLTVGKAATTASPGDTVTIGPGRFEEYVTLTRSNVTYSGSGLASLQGFRVNDAPGISLLSLELRGAQNSLGSHVRVENDSHNLVVSNCVIGPGVFAAEYPMVINTTNSTVSNASVDWAARGFRVGGLIWMGSSGLTNYQYNSYGYSWTITNISGTTLGLQSLSGSWTNETNTSVWAPINAGSTYEGMTGVQLIPASSYSASNLVVVNCTFTNLWGAGIVADRGRTVTIRGNRFEGLNGFKSIIPAGTNVLVEQNLFLNATNFVHYSPEEIGTFYHPSGGQRVYDYQIGFLHTGGGIARDVTIRSNWFENVHNPLGQFDDDPASTNLVIEGNVFVGVGASLSGGQHGTRIRKNTFYRFAYDEQQSTALTLGSGGVNGVTIVSNLFVDVGDHTSTNSGFYSVALSTQVETNRNLVAAAETIGFGPNRNFSETNGLNGSNPLFVNPHNPRGADGIPFTADDGLRPLPNSPIALLSWGALSPVSRSGSQPLAYFNQTTRSAWQDATGTNYNASWYSAPFYTRTNKARPYGTPENLGAVPAEIAFSATNSISGTWSTNGWYGISEFQWDFGDGATIITRQPTQSHVFLSPGTYTVALTAVNSAGGTNRTTRTYSVGTQSGYAYDVFHVATNGNDSTGTGSAAAPWLTIAKAASVVTAGDYVAVHAGYYPEFVDISRDVAVSTNRIQFIGYGARTSGFKVRVSNYTVRGFELDYSVSDGANSPQYTYQAADNIHWIDNYVHDTPDGIRGVYVAATGDPAPTNGALNGRVDNCRFEDIGYIVVEISNGSNWVVRANQVRHTTSEGDFIRALGSNHWIQDNWCSDLNNGSTGGHADFFQIPITSFWSKDIIIERNYVEGNLDNLADDGDAAIAQIASGVFATSTHTNIVWRNNIFNQVRGTLSDSIDGLKMYNNLFYKTPRAAGSVSTGGGDNGSSWGTVWKGNIFFESGGGTANNSGWYYNGTDGAQATNTTVSADYNFVCGTNGAAKLVAPPHSSLRWGADPTTQEANGINGGSPVFVDASTGDFRLRSTSTLIDAGANLSSEFTTDYLGQTRSGWSMGPFELPGEPPLRARANAVTLRIRN